MSVPRTEVNSDESPVERADPRLKRPNAARVWNNLLSGKDHRAADRWVSSKLLKVDPFAPDLAWANENFRTAATVWLTDTAGVTQFIDCGPGLPPRSGHSTHDVARSRNPAVRVLYVDNDPVVLSHGFALLATNERTRVAGADIFDPAAVLSYAADHLDIERPIALLHTATWPWFNGGTAAGVKIMQAFVDGLADGSYTVISHFLDPEVPGLTEHALALQEVLLEELGSGWFLPGDQVEALFPDQDLVGPGVVACDDVFQLESYYPNERRTRQCIAGGIGRVVRR